MTKFCYISNNISLFHGKHFRLVRSASYGYPEERPRTHSFVWRLSAGAVFVLAALLVLLPFCAAQTTATISGTVKDTSDSVIPGAKITVKNTATGDVRVATSNGAGFFAFPSLDPGTYSVQVTAQGFSSKELDGIILHNGDVRMVPDVVLPVGVATQNVTVQTENQIIPMINGSRSEVLSYKDLQNIAVEGRDITELMKVLVGVTNSSSGISNGSAYSAMAMGANKSALSEGYDMNGVPYEGGTALLSDGVNVLNLGDNGDSISSILPEMTQEVSVSTNFGADINYGPIVVSAISKSGGDKYHGEAYFDARNDALNANDWQSNHQGIPKGGAYYYYPGGNAGGPVPGTHKRLLFWGGYERWLQNQGNVNVLTSYIPSPEMMAGDFTSDNADNLALCPNGFSPTAQGNWCNDLTGTVLPDGTTVTNGHIPAQFLDSGAKALASFWPKPNANPATTPGGYNYYQPIINHNDGWVWRVRFDYNLTDATKVFISYQQAFNGQLANGTGANMFNSVANAIPFPGGPLNQKVYSKAAAGHLLHIFDATTTNEFIAAWGYASMGRSPTDITGAYKTTLSYPTAPGYGTLFSGGSKLIPSYTTAGPQTFPDFSQGDYFEPSGVYPVVKQTPSFTDNFTKVWGSHTVKMGAFAQNGDNYQGGGEQLNGIAGSFIGQNPNPFVGHLVGSPNNPAANFIMGSITSYSETNKSPTNDMAYQETAFYADDSWKVSRHLSVDYGLRVEHVGNWYDRAGNGLAVFLPDLVESDYSAGKVDPGIYWHSIDPGIPLSGLPNRIAFVSPRLGFSYDISGTGRTLIRGGWGAFRWQTQYNDMAPALETAKNISSYSLPGNTEVLLSQIGLINAPNSPSSLRPPASGIPGTGVTGTQSAVDPTDYGVPLTYAYNVTIDEQLPWNTLLEVGYVGNRSSQLNDNGAAISDYGNFPEFADQNKTPIGSLFNADPVTGFVASDPENVANTCAGPICNNLADYRPYGKEYGTNSLIVSRNIGYSNYNGLQVSWLKRAGRLSYNLNATWSKTLGTGAYNVNPFVLRDNYGVEAVDRPFVFSSSYAYEAGTIVHGSSELLRGAANGWTVSGISSWQAGGNLQALNSPNFGLTESYTNLPADASVLGITNAIGDPTYFGTDAPIAIMPVLKCNPESGLANRQRVQLKCFSAPAVGTQGGQKYPYMSMAPMIENDLALSKTFVIRETQNVQFRISAFNWLNHPLPQFSSSDQLTLRYLVDYPSKAIVLNMGAGGTVSNFGVMDQKTGAPNQRIVELNVKYNF
jgi:hypothetical protein